MDYLKMSEREKNTTRQNHALTFRFIHLLSPQHAHERTGVMYCRDPENDIIQRCARRTQRFPTMYTLLNGGQGPHTIPFGLLHAHFQCCTQEQMDALVPKPSQYKQMTMDERIPIGEAILDEYKKIYLAYKENQRRGIPAAEPKHVGVWREYGWRQLGEMLVNRLPYATYHWREKIDTRTKKGKALLAAKGTERQAISEYEHNKGIISLSKAIDAVDISEDHGFISIVGLRRYLYNVLMQMVRDDEVPSLKIIIDSMG